MKPNKFSIYFVHRCSSEIQLQLSRQSDNVINEVSKNLKELCYLEISVHFRIFLYDCSTRRLVSRDDIFKAIKADFHSLSNLDTFHWNCFAEAILPKKWSLS